MLISAKIGLTIMPKTYPKAHPKKGKLKKNPPKAQLKQASILKSKFYWITLTTIIIVFTVAYGVLTQIPLEKELLMLGAILSVLGFAFYIGFRNVIGYNKRATFIFVGASIVGFSIWVAIVLSFNAAGIISQIANSIGEEFFSATTLTICLVLGAFIGDLIGKNKEPVMSLAYELRGKIRK